MSGFRNQILIFEDDQTLDKALNQALSKSGFTVHSSRSMAEAIDLLNKKPIGSLFIDCLLPEKSGVEFVEEIRKKYPADILDVYLMSGFFTDQAFIKESMRSTQAKHFLKKPFDLQEAVALIEPPEQLTVPEILLSPRKALYMLFNRPKVTSRDKRKAIEALDEIHGFDLPYIYSLLVESQASGHLNIATKSGLIYGISFSMGHIVHVDVPDKETFLGRFLIDGGWVKTEDLEACINDKSSNKKMGEKLISSFSVSPHAIDIALAQQMNLRLSRTICDESVVLSYVESTLDLNSPNIDPELFSNYLQEWMASEISLSWLKNHYVQWSNAKFLKTPFYNDDHPAFSAPLVQALKGLKEDLNSEITFDDLLESKKFPEEALYKAVHYLLTRGLYVLKEKNKGISDQERYKFLKKLLSQISNMSDYEVFETMALIVSLPDTNTEAVLREFKKLFGPIPDGNMKELSNVYEQLILVSQKAYEFAKSGDRDKAKEKQSKTDIEDKLKAAQEFDLAKNFLQTNNFKSAYPSLLKIQKLDPDFEKLRLYLIWARIGQISNERKDKEIQEIETEILQIPAEEKYDAVYSYIQGLIAKLKGDLGTAKKLFEKAVTLDSQMIVAKRELNIMMTQSKKKSGLDMDLKDIVGSLFKRK